jgi:hypothetical protein
MISSLQYTPSGAFATPPTNLNLPPTNRYGVRFGITGIPLGNLDWLALAPAVSSGVDRVELILEIALANAPEVLVVRRAPRLL